MKDGYVDAEIAKILFIGAAGSGKTSTIYLLFGWPPPSDRHSTGCIDPFRAISCIKVSSDGDLWEKVDSAKLRSLLASDIYFNFRDSSASSQESSFGPAIPPSGTGIAVAREMYDGMPEVGKLGERKWIYIIDSGGQSQFHQVLSAFLNDTSASVFVFNLSEELSDHPLMELYDAGTRCGKSYRSPLTNEQIFRSCIQTTQSLQYTTEESKSPKLFVVGSHQDKEKPGTRAGKNKQLMKILLPTEDSKKSSFHDNIVFSSQSREEVIFPVDATSREKPIMDIAQDIRNTIASIDLPIQRIPHRWYGLELEIESFATAKNRMVVTLEECLERGKKLYFPSDEAVKAALVHLHNLNIFLYYPNVLPNLVFTNPCVLLDKVRELVQRSYELKGHYPLDKPYKATEGKWSHFCDRGIITLDILETFPSHIRDRDYLTSHQLVQLFDHLLIATPISDTEFFMPALLDLLKQEDIVKLSAEHASSEYASSYVISFPNGYAPCGLCSALVACLRSSSHNCPPWAFATCSGKLHGNCITFSVPDYIASVTVIDFGSFFEVHVSIDTEPSLRRELYTAACPRVRQTVVDCLKKAIDVRKFKHVKYTETILCHCTEAKNEPHPATIQIETPRNIYCWRCVRNTAACGELKNKELVWFPEAIPTVPTQGRFRILPHMLIIASQFIFIMCFPRLHS